MNKADIADFLLVRAGRTPTVVLGPVVWRPTDGTRAKQWYFHTAVTDPSGVDGASLHQLDCDSDDYDGAAGFRDELVSELAGRGRMVVHVTNDELQMACLCEASWPGERFALIRAQIELERDTGRREELHSAHEIIALMVERMRAEAEESEQGMVGLIEYAVQRAQTFKFDILDPAIYGGFLQESHRFSLEVVDAGLLRPPSSQCIIELNYPDQRHVFLLDEHGDHLWVYPFFEIRHPNGKVERSFLCSPFVAKHHLPHCPVTTDSGWLTKLGFSGFEIDTQGDREDMLALCEITANRVGQAIVMLNSKSADIRHFPVPERLNKQRLKKGKPPLVEYRRVLIKLPKAVAEAHARGGTHASPRMHFRRGHLRRLANGSVTPVSPCIVGAAEDGVILKEYRARLAS